MKLGLHLSDDAYAAIHAEAKLRGISESALIRERLDISFGVRLQKPRRVFKRHIFASHNEEE